MLEQLAVMDLKIDNKLNDVVLKREGAVAAFTDAITQVLQRPNPGPIALERVRALPPASRTIRQLRTGCQGVRDDPGRVQEQHESGDPRVCQTEDRHGACAGSTCWENRCPSKVRCSMVHRWISLRTKAKWCCSPSGLRRSPSCRSELLTVKTLYEKYHAQGFEVIGVCLDQDTAATTKVSQRDAAAVGHHHQQQIGRAVRGGNDPVSSADRSSGQRRGLVCGGIDAGRETRQACWEQPHPQHRLRLTASSVICGKLARSAEWPDAAAMRDPEVASPYAPCSSSARPSTNRAASGGRGPVDCSELVTEVVC